MTSSKAENPQDFHVETKDANEHLFSSSNIIPFEIEEGRVVSTGGKSDAYSSPGGMIVGASPTATKPERKSFCQKHWGKLLCLGITAIIITIIGILIPLLWFHMPTAELYEQSSIRINGLEGASMDLKLKVNNRNRYGVTFENLFVDIYNSDNVHIGTVERTDKAHVKARSTAIIDAEANLRASLIDFAAMGINCLANDNLTKIRIKGSSDGLLFGKKIKQVVGPFEQEIPCIATNVGPGGGVNPLLGGGNNNRPGIGNGQIINEIGNAINQGINNILGGGGGAAAGGRQPAAGGLGRPGAARL